MSALQNFWFENGEAVKDFIVNVIGSWLFFVSIIVAAFWIIVLSWFYFRPF